MTTGDIMFDDLSLYPRYNRLIGQIDVPWWHIGGNHDLNFEAPDAARSRETYKRTYGAPYYGIQLRFRAVPEARQRQLSRRCDGTATRRKRQI